MKKLFFSAVALVAFSSVSMGNTIDEKTKVNHEAIAVLAITPSCNQERTETYNDALANGASHYQAYFQAAAVWMECMKTVSINVG